MENHDKPECKLIGTDGNAFALIGKVKKCLRQHDPAALEAFEIDFSTLESEGGNYDDLLILISRHVDVV